MNFIEMDGSLCFLPLLRHFPNSHNMVSDVAQRQAGLIESMM